MNVNEVAQCVMPINPDFRDGSRLCENVHEPWMRRIVFSVVPSRWMLRPLVTFVFPKLRWKFYAPEQCQSFHTAWIISRPRPAGAACPFYPQERTSSGYILVLEIYLQ